jgi:hypothetical protein
MINNHDNKIAILTFKDDTEYYCDIRDNHVMYCKKNNYNYFPLDDKHEMLENIIENHEFFMLVDKKCLFLNQNILIEDLINSDLKYYYLENNNKYEVIIFRKNNESSKILKDIIKSKKMKDIVQHEKHIHYFDENQLYCYYNNYTPDKYILSIENIHQSINIRKQIQLFNNLIKHEDKNPKIIISVTTIPTRIKGLKKLVENLSSSTIKPDKIVFTITNKYKLFGESTEHIENINTLFKSEIKAGLVYINLIDIDKEEYNDYGPCNKWIGAYEYIKKEEFVDEFENDNYVVIVLDDDVIYHNNFIELLINKYNLNKRSIVTGYHSYSNYSIKNNYQMNVCIYKEHKKIPLLKGVNGTLLPKHLFCNNLNPLLKDVVDNGIKFFGKNDLVYQDDQIITTTLYYYRYNIVSVYDDLLSIGKKKSYTNNKINDDKKIDWHGVSYTNISKKSWYDRGLTGKFLHKFLKFYVYK